MTKVAENAARGKDIFCGIDLHQHKMLAAVAVDRGKPVFAEYDTDMESGVLALSERLHGLAREYGGRVWVTYEASGCGFLLADVMMAEGFETSVLAPTRLPMTSKSRSRKTDKQDALRLLEVLRGHVLAGNDLPSVWIPPGRVRDDRELVRRRLDLKEKETQVKNQIHGLLRRYGIKKPSGLKTCWTKRYRQWLSHTLNFLAPGAERTLASLIRELDYWESERAAVDRELAALAGRSDYRPQVAALTALKGVGVLTALVYLTELGDLSRFPNRRALASYLGLTPRSYESGEQDDRKGHISKQGPARVRKVLNQAAWAYVRWNLKERSWFRRRTPGGKNKKKMITAEMRRLAIVMWHAALAA